MEGGCRVPYRSHLEEVAFDGCALRTNYQRQEKACQSLGPKVQAGSGNPEKQLGSCPPKIRPRSMEQRKDWMWQGQEVPEGSHAGPCLSAWVSLVNSGGEGVLRVMPEFTDAVISFSSMTPDKVFSINAVDHDVFCVHNWQTKLPFLIAWQEKKDHLFDIFYNHFTCLPPTKSPADLALSLRHEAGSMSSNKPVSKDCFLILE